jgi:hypothetical protein
VEGGCGACQFELPEPPHGLAGGQPPRSPGLRQSHDSSHSSEPHVTSQRHTAALSRGRKAGSAGRHTQTFAAYRDFDGALPRSQAISWSEWSVSGSHAAVGAGAHDQVGRSSSQRCASVAPTPAAPSQDPSLGVFFEGSTWGAAGWPGRPSPSRSDSRRAAPSASIEARSTWSMRASTEVDCSSASPRARA